MQLHNLILSLLTFLSFLGQKMNLSIGFFLGAGRHPLIALFWFHGWEEFYSD